IYGEHIVKRIAGVEKRMKEGTLCLPGKEDYGIINLGKARDARAVPILLKIFKEYKKSNVARREAIDALRMINDPSCIAALKPMLYDEKEYFRENIAYILAGFKETQEDARNYALSDIHPRVAIRVLEIIGDDRAKEVILSLSNTDNEKTKQRAAFALLKLNEKSEAFSIFSELVKNTQNLVIKGKALRGLADIGDGKSVNILTNTLNDKNEEIRNTAFNNLESLATAEENKFAIQALEDVAKEHKDSEIRFKARKFLDTIQ
ncbi:HEAT repeat domain-containing protein, partial [bacterium]